MTSPSVSTPEDTPVTVRTSFLNVVVSVAGTLIVIIVVLYRRVEVDRVCKALTRLSIDVLLKIITKSLSVLVDDRRRIESTSAGPWRGFLYRRA